MKHAFLGAIAFSPALFIVVGLPCMAMASANPLIFGAPGILTSLASVVGVPVFMFLAFRNPKVPDDSRWVWVVCLWLFAIVAMPAYYFLYVREDTEG